MPKRFTPARRLPALLLVLGTSPATAQPVPPPIVQSHAECARPQYASDTLVCGDTELKALDAEVAALAVAAPVLAPGAIWEDQATWFRRRSLCAFKADHRGCLEAAYADRRAVLAAVSAAATQRIACTGTWRGRSPTASAIARANPVAIRENGLLLGVATLIVGYWQPMLAWRGMGRDIKLQTQDGRQFKCRPAPD